MQVVANIIYFYFDVLFTSLSGPGEMVWVPFNISVPRDTTMRLEVAVLTENIVGRSDRNGDNRLVVRSVWLGTALLLDISARRWR